jgi:hypothetical protein
MEYLSSLHPGKYDNTAQQIICPAVDNFASRAVYIEKEFELKVVVKWNRYQITDRAKISNICGRSL